MKEKLGEKKTQELIEKLRGDDKEMLQIIETIREENEDIRKEGRREGRREGKKEGKMEIIKNMLKEKMSLELISKVTGISIKEIKNIDY